MHDLDKAYKYMYHPAYRFFCFANRWIEKCLSAEDPKPEEPKL